VDGTESVSCNHRIIGLYTVTIQSAFVFSAYSYKEPWKSWVTLELIIRFCFFYLQDVRF